VEVIVFTLLGAAFGGLAGWVVEGSTSPAWVSVALGATAGALGVLLAAADAGAW